jgi:hypothetical protein
MKSMDMLSKVIIYESRDEKNTSLEMAEIKENGDLALEGYGAGDVCERVWGDGDYEYWLTVDKNWKDTVLLLLARERFKSFGGFRQWLDKKKIPNQFQNWV